jgi:hypothetical protein
MSKKFIIKDDASVHGNIDALTFNGAALPTGTGAVSYTHLTLPTILRV